MSTEATSQDEQFSSDAIFSEWYERGYFQRTAPKEGKGSYTIVIPPPNITGILHVGHALNDTIQDVCIRRARLMGEATRWVLGTDHAGIATQTKVDKKLADEGVSRLQIGREAFIDECWKWREEYGNTIVNQIKGMGCSCDYDNERFTLDEAYARAVRQVFADWYHDNLIYRGKRIVNWCPHCTTAIADDEAEYIDEKGHLWHLRYPLVEPIDGQDYIVVATTRPETMLGDTGVAVSPKDPSKKKFVGAKVKLPLVDREIPIFEDFVVDAEFGTGFVKVTPAHDPNDWGMGQRHDLPRINIFDETAHVVEGYGKFSGMDRDEARDAVVAAFEELGLLDHIEDHDHSVMTCYRCHTKLEPWESEQWFVAVEELKKPAAAVVESGQIQFHPERWKQVYLDWLANLKDWCISRQLWWGHRIPMYYCDACGWEDACVDEPHACPECGGTIRQDEDVLDTWFSSQLWPFATQGWTTRDEVSDEIQKFYPTQVLSTARDIMGLWVARMVMSSMYCTGQIPFEHVIIHPTVLGADGKPMSKSRGNGIDPFQLMADYGVDGMRFGLLAQVTGSQEIRFNAARLENSRNFANKIRNAARFVGMNLDGFEPGPPSPTSDADRWIFSRLAQVVANLDAHFANFEFGEITRELYTFFWNELCDWYIEFSKSRLSADNDPADRLACQRNLMFVMGQAITLLHPIMPYVTEEIYQRLPFDRSGAEHLIVGSWPDAQSLACYVNPGAEQAFSLVCELVTAVRSTRARYGISPKQSLDVVAKVAEEDIAALDAQRSLVTGLANINQLDITSKPTEVESAVVVLGSLSEVRVILAGLVDFEAERARLQKEREKHVKDEQRLAKKLSNEGFLAKAAPEIIAKDRAKHAELQDKIAKIDQQLSEL